MRANSREAGITSAGRVKVVHEEHYVAQVRELLGISTHKRADRPGRAMDDQQSRKRTLARGLVDDHAYVLALRAVRKH
jgi:hypothetical protein